MNPNVPPNLSGDDLSSLLDELLQAGETPDRVLLDRLKAHGQAAVQPLIEMALDGTLYEADSPEGWAPIHAIKLLGELAATEAIEPLLPLYERVDDDYLAHELPLAYGEIGAPAFAPLRTLLFDRGKDVWARIRGAEGLAKIGRRHPETRSDVVSTLVERLDRSQSREADDEIVNGFVICLLLDLKAVEAAPAIRQAFDEERVDSSIVDLDSVQDELGLPRTSLPAPTKTDGLRLRLLCTACHYEREHDVPTIYVDLASLERREAGESQPHSEYIIPQRITCPKCGAIDQYELTSMAFIALSAELLKSRVAYEIGVPAANPEDGALRLIRFKLADGREMHPHAAREMYREQVAAEPNRADLRVRYANVLSFLGSRDEAVEESRAALRLEPTNLEAYLSLGRLAWEVGDTVEARRMFESAIAQAPNSQLPRQQADAYVRLAKAAVSTLSGPLALSGAAAMLARLSPHPVPTPRELARMTPPSSAPTVRKVGRNEPCPCGSGKKYKKCHGR